MTNVEREKMVQKIAMDLGEHFDSVQILCTWTEGGVTRDLFTGSGNAHARLNMAREYLERDSARTIAYELKELIDHEDLGSV